MDEINRQRRKQPRLRNVYNFVMYIILRWYLTQTVSYAQIISTRIIMYNLNMKILSILLIINKNRQLTYNKCVLFPNRHACMRFKRIRYYGI